MLWYCLRCLLYCCWAEWVEPNTYRVTLVVVHLGWADLDMGSSHGCSAAIVATYCPSRMVEHHKYKSTQPRCTTTSVTLYLP